MNRFVYLAFFLNLCTLIDGHDAVVSLSRLFSQSNDVDVKQSGCGCSNLSCGCCAHLQLKDIGLNDTVCVNITYIPKDIGVSLTVSLNGVVYYNKTVSVRNPPPLCFGVPYLKKYASLCIQLYSLAVKNHTLSGCVRVVARLEGVIVEKFELGCFRIPPGKQHEINILRFQQKTQKPFEYLDWDPLAKLMKYIKNEN